MEQCRDYSRLGRPNKQMHGAAPRLDHGPGKKKNCSKGHQRYNWQNLDAGCILDKSITPLWHREFVDVDV